MPKIVDDLTFWTTYSTMAHPQTASNGCNSVAKRRTISTRESVELEADDPVPEQSLNRTILGRRRAPGRFSLCAVSVQGPLKRDSPNRILSEHRCTNELQLPSRCSPAKNGFTLRPVRSWNSRKAFSRRSHELTSLERTAAWCPWNVGQAFSREPHELTPPW